MKIIKYLLARLLRWKMMPLDMENMDKRTANKFNYLSNQIIARGRLRWDWGYVMKTKEGRK